MTSCDEFPFASTLQGGNHDGVAAIVRGVPRRHNDVQGGQFGAFLTERYNELAATRGVFDVCVIQYDAGACDKGRQRQVKKWVTPAAKP
jgi:hypothetical protein